MSNYYVKDTLRTLILGDESNLVSGLTIFGNARSIHRVTTTRLTPADGYFCIYITTPSSSGFSNPNRVSNTRQPTRASNYDVQILVLDEARVQGIDTNAYDAITQAFDTFVDRIEVLIEGQTWIGSDPKLQLARADGDQDRRIDRVDLSGTWLDAEGTDWASLISRLSFTLEGC